MNMFKFKKIYRGGGARRDSWELCRSFLVMEQNSPIVEQNGAKLEEQNEHDQISEFSLEGGAGRDSLELCRSLQVMEQNSPIVEQNGAKLGEKNENDQISEFSLGG